MRSILAPLVAWGRPSPEGKRLKDTTLTHFSPEVWTGLYAPLFMFTGDYTLGFDPTERLFRARLPALFRNGLDPGLYPYPFWHDARKWADYQSANGLTLWIHPGRSRWWGPSSRPRARPTRGCGARRGLHRHSTASGCGRTRPG